MEDNTSLFSLTIDPVTKTHLSETAKWARFMAIVGFIFLLLMIAFGVFYSMNLSRYQDMYGDNFGGRNMMQAVGAGMIVMYVIIAIIAFFPLLFMLRFANKMRSALNGNDQELLNSSFQNLKIYFRYTGIMVIIGLVLMAISLLMGIASTAVVS